MSISRAEKSEVVIGIDALEVETRQLRDMISNNKAKSRIRHQIVTMLSTTINMLYWITNERG